MEASKGRIKKEKKEIEHDGRRAEKKRNSSAEAGAFVFVFHLEEHAYFPRHH